MKSGKLGANYYGAYMVQDIAYLAYGADAYRTAALHTEGRFRDFYIQRATLLESDYLKPMVTKWHLKDDKKVVLGKAAINYVSFLFTVSREQPKCLAIAMLPCSMLWRWMAD